MAKNLSKFVFKQLVYDYLCGDLTGDELEKFESKVQAEGDCFDYVELTKKSIQYVEGISSLVVKPEAASSALKYKQDGLFYLYNPFAFKVPKLFKVGIPVLMILSALVLVGSIFPLKEGVNWLKSRAASKVVVSINAEPEVPELTNYAATDVRDVKIELEAPMEFNNFKVEKDSGSQKLVNNKLDVVENIKLSVESVNKSPTNNARLVSEEFVTKIDNVLLTNNKTVGKNMIEKAKVEPAKVEVTKEVVKKKRGPQGTLHRAYMSIRNLDAMTPKIVEIIERMSGEKAGQKRLGYLKPKGRSFHFKLPLNYRDQVFEELKAFGRVKVDKEKHWRKMPEGQSRVILWVEDLDLKAERMKSR